MLAKRVALFIVLSLASVQSRPVQLIRPSKEHDSVEVCPEGLEILRTLDAPVAVISAVGAIHTGKSFLLNQLLGVRPEDEGFPVGYTVRPETSGMWIWNAPQVVEGTRIIYLDTEGLFSPNVTSIYDAKLFAIATLLSSEVIYNTVKFIDNAHVEALELLIRRTNLFGLRAYARQSADPIESSKQISNISAFLRLLVPNQLSWVVQDFVQDLGRTQPEEWLRELLQKDTRQDASVGSFFSHVDCVPLPLPSGKASVLQKLDQARPDELDEGYLRAVRSFRSRLTQRAAAHPKVKATEGSARSPMSGRDIAELLTFLVQAANMNTGQEAEPFPQLPSMAEQFTSLQLRLMKSDILTIEEQDLMTAAQQAYNAGKPLTQTQFNRAVEEAEGQAHALWNSAVKGLVTHRQLAGELERAETDFVEGLAANRERVALTNCDFVKDWCKEFTGELLRDFNTSVMAQTDRPMLPSTLNALLSRLEMPITTRFHDTMSKDSGSWAFGNTTDCCASSLMAFSDSLRAASDAARRRNDRLTMKSFQQTQQMLLHQWEALLREKAHIFSSPHPVLVQTLRDIKKSLIDQFDIDMSVYASLPVFRQQRSELDGLLETQRKEVESRWEAGCQEQADKFLRAAEARFAYDLTRVVSLPAQEDALERAITQKSEELKGRFRTTVFCASSPFGRRFTDRLERLLLETAQNLRKQNIDTYKAISQGPLEEVKAELKKEAESFIIPCTFRALAEKRVVEALSTAVHSYEELSVPQREVNNEASLKLIAQVAKRCVEEDLSHLSILIWVNCIGCLSSLSFLAISLFQAVTLLRARERWRAAQWTLGLVALLGLVAIPNGRSLLRTVAIATLTPTVSSMGPWVTLMSIALVELCALWYFAAPTPPKVSVERPLLRDFDQPSPFANVGPYGAGTTFAHTPANNRASIGAYYGDDLYNRQSTQVRSRLSCPGGESRMRK